MKHIDVGDKVPDFTFESTDPAINSFASLKGKNVILYFYPKDHTPGCTMESKDFRDVQADLIKLNTQVIGVSRDSLVCHQKFDAKHSLGFPLISDPDEKLCAYFNVIIEKNMFKRIFLGIDRTTFLINKNGIIQHVWRNVKVKGHAKAVLEAVQQLEK